MKKSFIFVLGLIVSLLILPVLVSARLIDHGHHHHYPRPRTTDIMAAAKPDFYTERSWQTRRKGPDTVQVAGSSLPDCFNACGSCRPCRLVMISFACSTLEEAETCPIDCKCICNKKPYPIP